MDSTIMSTYFTAERLEMYFALGLMVTAAVLLVYVGSKRGLASFKDLKKAPETLSATDAAAFPISGSMALFSMYVLVKYIPAAYVGLLLGFYLSVFAVFALNYFVRPYIGANFFVGASCIAVGFLYFYTDKHWMITNIFGVSIAVVAIQSMVVGSFATGAILLCGLFFYDIFWVFGTDVMVSVATNIDGPIKILCPQAPITRSNDRMSLLGLGDIVIPGFYIALICVFSTLGRDAMKAKKSQGKKVSVEPSNNIYFVVAMVAYALSLINTMVVMIVFKHAQPALLYIVPWLLITTLITAVVKGELQMLLDFDTSLLFEDARDVTPTADPTPSLAMAEEDNQDTIMWIVKDFFGMNPEEAGEKIPVAKGGSEASKIAQGTPAKANDGGSKSKGKGKK